MSKLMNSYRPLVVALFVVGFTGGLTGCNRPAGSVTGKVTFQGRPLSAGTVILYCENRQIFHGLIGPNGTYTISNVPPGQVRVTVRTLSHQRELWHPTKQKMPVVNGPVYPAFDPSKKGSKKTIIPARYELPEESGLSVVVVGGETVFDIDLIH